MRHARSDALDALAPLLDQLRHVPGLKERGRGVFYLGSTPFLHFHEDPAGLFADARFGDDFERLPIGSEAEQLVLLDRVRAYVVP